MKEMQISYLSNFGLIQDKVPTKLFSNIKKEISQFKSNNYTEMISGLSGNNIPKHYWMRNNIKEWKQYILNLSGEYEKHFKYLKGKTFLNKSVACTADTPWFNFQQKYEFIPVHNHEGIYSYVLWIKIPYDIDKECVGKNAYASCFELFYTSITGDLKNYKIKVSKNDEGTVTLFPAYLSHCVYPFSSVNGVRISMSGNIFLNSQGATCN